MIAGHGFDHRNITTISGNEWERQISKPLLSLEKITEKPVNCFAYPFGAWNETAIVELKKRGIKMAFQLMTRQSKNEPLFTIRRLMISGLWTPVELERRLAAVF
jgi:peptidoglycan/xylan/chitin deacetylase (PgdA/CDA1 family)